jgi:hypothetical protein
MTLDTEKEIKEFFREQSDVMFVIDQVNALDNKATDMKTRDLSEWLRSLWVDDDAIAILSSSANNHSILNEASKQSTSEIMYVYGGLTRVSPRRNNQFVKRGLV